MPLIHLTEENPKTIKGRGKGYLTLVLSMPPGDESGKEMCPYRTEACYKDCLGHSTHYVRNYPAVKEAQMRRARRYIEDPKAFVEELRQDVQWGLEKAHRLELKLAVRFNKATDILWERTGVMDGFHEPIFYDYTKVPLPLRQKYKPANYHLTYSYSGSNTDMCKAALRSGSNVAVVFRQLPKELWGYPVINGDLDDLRFLDPTPCVVGLSPKGTLKYNKDSKFIMEV